MPSKRSRGGRSRSSSARSKRRQGHPAAQAEARRRDEEAARDQARRSAVRRSDSGTPTLGSPDDADPARLAERVADGLRDVARGISDPLEAALVGSEVCEPWAVDSTPDEEAADGALPLEVVRLTAQRGDDVALAVLRTLEVGATERTARAAALAARRLVADGRRDPRWFAATQGLAPTAGAILHEDVFDDGVTVMLEFAGPEHGAHTLGVHIDRNFDGIATDLVVGPSLDGIAEQVAAGADDPENGRLRLERVDLDDARNHAVIALGRAIATPNRPFSDNVRPLWGFALQRLALFPGEVPPEAVKNRPVPAAASERHRLIDAFFASPGAPERDDASERIVRTAVDYAADRAGGDPARWSPKVVGMFRLEWVDGEPALPPELAARVPEVMRAWVAFAAAERGVGAHWSAKALAAVDAEL